MFFDSIKQIPEIIQDFSTTIFVVDPELSLPLKPLVIAEPPSADTLISIDEIRDIIRLTETKQTANLFLLVRHAELLTESASNALLKTIEEPGNQIHIIFLTQKPHLLLPTIRSRAILFRLKQKNMLASPPKVTPEILDYAKKLLVATPTSLLDLAEELSKKKPKKTAGNQENDKTFILKIIETTIELAYKSYFKTRNPLFLKKIEGLDTAYSNISKNGNKKLQLVANLL